MNGRSMLNKLWRELRLMGRQARNWARRSWRYLAQPKARLKSARRSAALVAKEGKNYWKLPEGKLMFSFIFGGWAAFALIGQFSDEYHEAEAKRRDAPMTRQDKERFAAAADTAQQQMCLRQTFEHLSARGVDVTPRVAMQLAQDCEAIVYWYYSDPSPANPERLMRDCFLLERSGGIFSSPQDLYALTPGRASGNSNYCQLTVPRMTASGPKSTASAMINGN